jgi:predicted RNase H-like HicB family nuclease
MNNRFLVLIEKGDSSYGAYNPDVPGCIAVGDTEEETLELMKEALQGHLGLMAQDGDPMPTASHIAAHFVEIDTQATVPTHS